MKRFTELLRARAKAEEKVGAEKRRFVDFKDKHYERLNRLQEDVGYAQACLEIECVKEGGHVDNGGFMFMTCKRCGWAER